MITWEKVASNEKYQSLNPEEQQVAKDRWFDAAVRTDKRFKKLSTEDQETAQQRFYAMAAQEPGDDIISYSPEEPDGYVETFGKGVVRGAEGIVGGVGDMAQWAGEVTGAEPLAEAGSGLSDYMSEAASQGWAAPDSETFSGTFMQNPSVKRAFGIIGEAFPSMGFGMGVGSLARMAGMSIKAASMVAGSGLASLEGSGSYVESRDKGKDIGESSFYGALATGGTALLEATAIGKLFSIKGSRLLGAAKGAVIEGTQEVAQTGWQNLIAKVGYDDARNLADGMIESFIGGAGVGGTTGAFTATAEEAKDNDDKNKEAEENALEKGVTPEELKGLEKELIQEVLNLQDAHTGTEAEVEAGQMERPIAQQQEESEQRRNLPLRREQMANLPNAAPEQIMAQQAMDIQDRSAGTTSMLQEIGRKRKRAEAVTEKDVQIRESKEKVAAEIEQNKDTRTAREQERVGKWLDVDPSPGVQPTSTPPQDPTRGYPPPTASQPEGPSTPRPMVPPPHIPQTPTAGKVQDDTLPEVPNVDINVKAIRESTGEEIDIKQNAKEAANEIDTQIEKYKKLIDCLAA